MSELICRANKLTGVTFFSDNKPVRRISKTSVSRERIDKQSDEDFINTCLHGLKHYPKEIVSKMDLDRRENICTLHRKAMTAIVNMKKEISKSWNHRAASMFKSRTAKALEISDIDVQDMYLEIEIPRPLLIQKLLTLKN
jgi:hypothetical protein